MTKNTQILMASFCAFVLGYLVCETGVPNTYAQGFKAGFESGHKQGKFDALLPNETNHELQEVCLSIWIGNQLGNQK
jgi:hypothetical protein